MRVLFDYHELWDVVESEVSTLVDNAIEGPEGQEGFVSHPSRDE